MAVDKTKTTARAAILPELLAPAGDLKKLEVALGYGADAVYIAGKKLGMRAACKNFDYGELKAVTLAAHCRKKKVYVALNIFPFDEDLGEADEYLDYLSSIDVDGLIISDLGLINRAVKRTNIPVHVSTQANVTNTETAKIYAGMGVKRIVLARELSLGRIKKLRAGLPKSVELEAFVHGAMCVSYSGRCLLSAYLSGRSANRGECNQACRMRFAPEKGEVRESEECERSLEFVEDDGTYVFGGNDLNMIEHLSELISAGISAFKIEGRVKSEYYVGCVTGAYRRALDCIASGREIPESVREEPKKAPNRGFNTGFYFGDPKPQPQCSSYDFCGIVTENGKAGAVVEMRNRFKTGDVLEVLSPSDRYNNTEIAIPEMTDENGERVTDAKVPKMHVTLDGVYLPPLSMLRRSVK